MVTGKDILIVAQPSWDGDYMKAVVELAKVFSQNNRVLYVEAPDTYSLFSKVKKKKGLIELHNNLYHLVPHRVLPANRLVEGRLYNRILQLNSRKLLKDIDATLKELSFEPTILINGLSPYYGLSLLDHYPQMFSVYYCYDDIGGRVWNARHGVPLEKEVLRRYDLTICTSDTLAEVKGELAHKTAIVYNGVRLDLFRQEVESFQKKDEVVLGFLGSLDERVDITLLTEIAQKRPQWQIKLVGRYEKKIEEKLVLPNISCYGSQPIESLPQWLSSFTVALIPFVKDQFTTSIYPIKINEYLAGGKPVISTDFSRALSHFSGFISVVERSDEFIEKVEEYLEGRWCCSPKEMKEKASKASWEERGKEFLSIIEKSIPQ